VEDAYKELAKTLTDLHDDLPENVQKVLGKPDSIKADNQCRYLTDVGTQLGAHRREGAVDEACDAIDVFVMQFCPT
jgi:hypothetical protein